MYLFLFFIVRNIKWDFACMMHAKHAMVEYAIILTIETGSHKQ